MVRSVTFSDKKNNIEMGKLYQGIEGPFSGKVGTVVGYMWKNRSCIRA